MVKKIERSALVRYSAQQMFDLVNDVEAYPQYISGCKAAQVLARGDNWLEARMELQKAGISQTFVTRNTIDPPRSMRLTLKSGPFKSFMGEWNFESLAEDACKVMFCLEYEFSSRLLGLAVGKIFEQLASEQVDAICKRAAQIY